MQNLIQYQKNYKYLVARHLGEGELQLLGDPLVLLLLRHKLVLQPVHLNKSEHLVQDKIPTLLTWKFYPIWNILAKLQKLHF